MNDAAQMTEARAVGAESGAVLWGAVGFPPPEKCGSSLEGGRPPHKGEVILLALLERRALRLLEHADLGEIRQVIRGVFQATE